jgi:hypothetical protein
MVADGAERSQELLSVFSRFEPAHEALALTRRLVRILSSVVQTLVAMVDVRQHPPQCWSVAGELVGDDHPWLASGRSDDASQEGLSSVLIASLLYQHVEDDTLLIDSTPITSDAGP